MLEQTWRTSPSAVALTDSRQSLTRGQLNARVRQLTGELSAAGVRHGDIVAVYIERSVELVLAQLAILFAGAVHVAIDPDDPPRRLEHILDDCAPVVVVCSPTLAERVPPQHLVHLVNDPSATTATISPGKPPRPVEGADGAYLIYTSGTTGDPKASLITHAGLASRLRWLQEFCPMSPSDVVLYKTACGFDVSVAELYWTLTAGGRLFCARPGAQRDTDYLADVLVEQGVTILHYVPSLLDLFLASRPEQERYDSVRYLLAGGEALSPDLARRWQARSTGLLINLYGPSECSVYTTAWKCPPLAGGQRVLIGEAVAETGLWVLDANFEPIIDLNSPGELYVSGVGLARGYLGRSDLTAARFLNLSELNHRLPAVRAYRTGDLVAWAEPGRLDFRGRADRQVKIRGHRIEPGEIEAAAGGLPGVAQCVVAARGGDYGTELLLFVVAADRVDVPDELVGAVRMALAAQLPPYMQPRRVLLVTEVPLSPNGKLDEPALLALAEHTGDAGAIPPSQAEVVHGRLPLETWWTALLNTPATDDSDFFLSGGDSFVAVRLMKEISAAAGRRVPIKLLFAHPVLGDFRKEVEAYLAATSQV
ncbi:MAG: non-ribosomal peptide synthetase [Nocardioides sp.]|uniref:non-ribosomal peptide synthetase n=1 Tax=Nocardioides sp. TaxID=35761 RepID=UPI0023A28D25|nr:non-ribosomal peptide synthetase [Nocardioides sp.]MDE0777046.1 non-ribosomal peptide synthetase [Nocardioides sp.]